MKSIFVTGLALGNDNNACQCCNVDISWIFNYSSSFLWLDKIYVSSTIWNLLMANQVPFHFFAEDKSEAGAKVVKLIFEILDAAGLIEVVNIKDVITDSYRQTIYDQIDKDLKMIVENVHQDIHNDGHLLYIGEYGYCVPQLWTTYASLILSRYYDANCLLSPSESHYIRQLFALKDSPVINDFSNYTSVIQEIFSIYLPNNIISHSYLYDSMKTCESCIHEIECKSSFLNEIEKQMLKILEQREYDEVHQFNMVLDKICEKKFQEEYEIDKASVLKELAIKKLKIQRQLNNVFPKIERWSNFTTTISATLSLSAFVDKPLLASVGSAGILIAQGAKALIDLYSSKYKWVNFINTEK